MSRGRNEAHPLLQSLVQWPPDLAPRFEAGFVRNVRAHARRSLAGIPFPPSYNLEERRRSEDILSHALQSHAVVGSYRPCHGSTSHGESMSPIEEDALRAEFHLYVNQRTAFWQYGELGREWPDGRGIFVSADKVVIGWTNEEEHLQLLAVDHEGSIEKVCTRLWNDLGHVEAAIQGRGLSGFERHPQLGYLTANPAYIGLAFHLYCAMVLPLLTKTGDFKKLLAKHGLAYQAPQPWPRP